MSILDSDLAEIIAGRMPAPEPVESAPQLEVVKEERPAHPQWMKYRPQFAQAMEGGLHRVEDVERLMGQGKAIFFPGKNAAVIAEKVEYGPTAVLQVLWCVGDMEEILSLAPGIEAMGRLLGCSSMLIEGRRGWEKALKSLDYEFWSVTLRKAL